MPGRARGQLVLFEQHAVGEASLGQMVEGGDADRAATDDHHCRLPRELAHAASTPLQLDEYPARRGDQQFGIFRFINRHFRLESARAA